jgi:tetratricopeptide (TPR) repeat protein
LNITLLNDTVGAVYERPFRFDLWENRALIERSYSCSRAILLILLLLITPIALQAQVDDAKAAIDRGEYARAINILNDEIARRPSADAYVYLGIAYTRIREFEQAENVLNAGAGRFPDDARFHNELAGAYLATNDVEKARGELRRALVVDPANAYASDLLANIDMSEGEVQSALQAWNKSGRPIIDDVLNNGYLTFTHWTLRRATAFHPAGVLKYSEWRTTERRVLETGIFTSAGIEVQPDPVPDHYDANLLTILKTNSISDFAFNAFKGALLETTYFNIWNANDSGLNVHSMFRWEANRRRAELGFHVPLPVGNLLFLDATGIWRSEVWDSKGQSARYKSTGGRIELKYIPDYRFEIGTGFEYRNRAGADDRNFGKILGQTSIRLADGGYSNRLHADAFATNQYRGGTLELNNRLIVSKSTATILDWTLKAGSSRGSVPVDERFLLGVDIQTTNLLRGHAVAEHGRLGGGPAGTEFGLLNFDVERRISILPLFNTFNLPYLNVVGEVFADAAKTNEIHKILVDVGAGVKLESPTHALNLIYGRSLRDGQALFAAYIEKRWW